MNATINAERIPINSDPAKITLNYITLFIISSLKVLVLSVPIALTVSYMTIAMASLKMLSPNTHA
jgi:hypothetical protein